MLIFIVSSWPAMERKNHYAIVVDAGSSGSRAYLYHWPEENTSDLLKITPLTDAKNEPLVKSVSPGKVCSQECSKYIQCSDVSNRLLSQKSEPTHLAR